MNVKLMVTYRAGSFAEITFNRTARKVFCTAAKMGRSFLEDKNCREIAKAVSPQIIRNWEAGLDVLDKLAFVPSDPIHLSFQEAHASLSFTATMALTKASVGQTLFPLPQALLLLGQIAPCAITQRELPLIQEQSWTQSSHGQDAFDDLRRAMRVGEPIIPTTQAYLLWRELLKLEEAHLEVHHLIMELEIKTRMFRTTMKQLAAVDLKLKTGGKTNP